MPQKFIYKTFSIAVDTQGSSFNKKFDLDKTIKLVRGLQISASDPKQLFYRGAQRIEVSGEELFPEGYPSKLLMSGIHAPQEERFLELGDNVLSGNGEVKILYKDTENAGAAFAPYTVHIVLKCELNR